MATTTPHLPPPPILTTLPSGLRIATTENPKAPMMSCVIVECGSRFEPDELHMISLSMCLRASLARIRAIRGREIMLALVEDEGNNTCEPLERLADFVQNTGYFEHAPVIDLRRMDRMQALQQQKTYNYVLCKLHEVAFRNHPLGRFPEPADSFPSITTKHIKDFVSEHYTAARMVVSVAGDSIKHNEVVKHVEKFFKHLPSDPTTASQLVSKSPATFTASEVRMLDENQHIAHFAVAFRGASTTDQDYIALQVIAKMLGSVNNEPGDEKNMGSELAKIVDTKNLAKTMQVISCCYRETGLFGVYASAEPHCLDDLAKAIMFSISKLSYLVLEEDVARARQELEMSTAHSLLSAPIAAATGEEIITHGRKIPVEEVLCALMQLMQLLSSVLPNVSFMIRILRFLRWDQSRSFLNMNGSRPALVRNH